MHRVIVRSGIFFLLTACGGQGLTGLPIGGVGGVDVGGALESASELGKAATLTDEEVKAAALQLREYEEEHQERVAPASSSYAKRLAKLTNPYRNYNGMDLNFKVYESNEVNANATADGSIRVYTGLMDLMNDDEMLFVIGHEIGHVAQGHTAKQMRVALATSGLRKGASASGTSAGALVASELGGMLEAVLNAQYSQGQETESDDFGLQFLRKTGNSPDGAESSLRKLAKLSGGEHSILSSHPDPDGRADRIGQMVRGG